MKEHQTQMRGRILERFEKTVTKSRHWDCLPKCGAEWLRLILVLVLLFVVQVAHVNGPYRHRDETIALKVVERLRTENTLDTNWKNAETPELFRYEQYNFSSYLIASRFLVEVTLLPVQAGIVKMSGRSFGPLVEALRLNSALLGLLTCFFVYLVIRRTLGSEIFSLFGALLLGLAPLWIQSTHCARPETFTGCLSIATTLLALAGGAVCLVAALFLGGVLLACKISTVFMVIPPALLLVVESCRNRRWGLFVVGSLAPVVGALMGMPFAFSNPSGYLSGIAALRRQYGRHILPFSTVDSDFQFVRSLEYFVDTQGLLFLVMVICGVAWLVYQREWIKLWVIAAPPVMTWLFFCVQLMFFERNLAHVLPHMFVLVVVGCCAARRAFQKYLRWRSAVAALCFGLSLWLLVKPAWVSSILVFRIFSGAEQTELRAYQNELVARQSRELMTPLPIVSRELFSSHQLNQLFDEVESRDSPAIYRFPDLNNPKSRFVEEAVQRCGLVHVGSFESALDFLHKNEIRYFFAPSIDYLLLNTVTAFDHRSADEIFLGGFDDGNFRPWTPNEKSQP